MIDCSNEKNCCGCKNCANICPQGAITMVEGRLGHISAKVNTTLCTDCGACRNVCPMLDEISSPTFKKKMFAAYSENFDIRQSGSSGGIFGCIADHLIKEGFSVYGAAFDKDLKLVTTSAETRNELKPLFKSKYLLCDTADKFSEIKKKLKSGNKVLYVSTPCQVFALKKYLGSVYENLLTVDFFCHGVPSQRFFDECTAFDENQRYNGRKTVSFSFREKKKGGSTPHYFSLETEDGERHTGYYFDSTFYAAFQKYICLRESCYGCRFSSADRPSDITIGDFHEIDGFIKGINRFDGISKVIINSEAGMKLWEDIKDKLFSYEFDIDEMIDKELIFAANTVRPNETDEFFAEYEKSGIPGLYKKYLAPSFYRKIRIYYSMPKFLRNAIKKAKGLF
ncbi:MAG: Coenzyme F420 hydrogenase/dehydrogenase, beta subunit C-terminal domain [Clostridia bacterium]|nr:Coenzyme F420 hydrogenase/dehydrogenase, beta subunit C-terminal domain [Clostridia bacterium]